jgi:hypothetical protein
MRRCLFGVNASTAGDIKKATFCYCKAFGAGRVTVKAASVEGIEAAVAS